MNSLDSDSRQNRPILGLLNSLNALENIRRTGYLNSRAPPPAKAEARLRLGKLLLLKPMPTIPTSELPIPKSWDEFEDICADLFALIWNDPNTVRYGRMGQGQNGVDIRGRLPTGGIAGVQCKRKRRWPEARLTIADIDREVVEALKFSPPLSQFIIATTAQNDIALLTHVDEISKRHLQNGLFSVHILSWSELSRRIETYSQLVEKYFHFLSLSSVRTAVEDIPQRTARLLTDNLREIVQTATTSAVANADGTRGTLEVGIAEAIQRDFELRYRQATQQSIFPEFLKVDLFRRLATEISETGSSTLPQGFRREIFFRAARSTALRNDVQAAEGFFAAGVALAGSGSESPARARIMEARGAIDDAIRLLRDENDSEARSVLLSIISRHRGDEAALSWLDEQGISVNSLTHNGILTVCQIYSRQQRLDSVKRVLVDLAEHQLRECPYFIFFRGVIRFCTVLSPPESFIAIAAIPLDVRNARPILPDPQLEMELDAARSDLERFLPIAEALELHAAARTAETYLMWCDLIHPRRRDVALIRLRSDMSDPAKALMRAQFAFAYDADNFDPAPLTKYLEQREAFGGLSSDELSAALVLCLHKNDPSGVSALIAKHREKFDQFFERRGILATEIQALAMMGDTESATLLLNSNRDCLGAEASARLNAEIARGEGADPVIAYKRAYETDKSVSTLRALLGALFDKREYRAIGPYAEELFALTGDQSIVVMAAKAYAETGDNDNFVRVVEANPSTKDADVAVANHYAWQLFWRGQLTDARQAADQLSKFSVSRDLNLDIALALESGEWETLAQALNATIQQAAQLSAATLMQAAHLAQVSGQGRLSDIIKAAVAKGGDDPNVLIGAYTLVLEEGLGELEIDAQNWFRRALDLSGPDGPIKQFALKEILSRQAEWAEHSRRVNEAIVNGDMPLLVAAPGLQITLVGIILQNFVRNAALIDGRGRSCVTVFSGRRGVPTKLENVCRLALDVSSLLILGWLGLLPKVLEGFAELVLPAGSLRELFEGRARIRRSQKSRLRRARTIRDFIAQGRLKVLRVAPNTRDPVVREIGSPLANLLRAAQTTNGIVVRPAPVHRLGVDDMRDADMSSFASILTDLHVILGVLHERGAVEEAAEETAKRYFTIQDRGWHAPIKPDIKQPIYLDSLSVVYLDTVGLLDPFLKQFANVYIDLSVEEEAFALLEHERHVAEVLQVIDEIRETVRKAYSSGKIVFGPRWRGAEENDFAAETPSLHLIGNFLGAEAVVFDDRALNKDLFMTDSVGHRCRVVTSLDIIETLHASGVISTGERRAYRHRLRAAGASLVPFDSEEVRLAATRNALSESREFRALRDSLDLSLKAEIPIFPQEIPWFMAVTSAIRIALMEIWRDDRELRETAAAANAIYELHPKPEDWISCWKGQPPPGWIVAVNLVIKASLALPFELNGDQRAIDNYVDWLDRAVLVPMRKMAPGSYASLVEHLKAFIRGAWSEPRDTSQP